MDFDKLYLSLPKIPEKWSIDEISIWLAFIGLENYSEKFRQTAIDGASILLLENEDLVNDLQINSSMIRKKILNWTKYGLKEFSNYVQKMNNPLKELNKENINNMQIENFNEIPKFNKELIKKNSICEEISPNENTNPISSVQLRFINNENDQTNPLQISPNNFLINQQNIKERQPINSNPFTANALASDLPEFSNFFHQNPNSNINIYNNNPNPNAMIQENPFPFINRNFNEGILCAFPSNMNKTEELIEEDDYITSKHKRDQFENNINIKNIEKSMIPQDNELIIQPTEGAQTTFYCIKDTGGKIGRHSTNQMVILEESVSRFHAEILFKNNEFYIRDIGSTTGTFLKILSNIALEIGMIIEMGSNQFLVEKINCSNNSGELVLLVFEGPNSSQRLNIILKDQKSCNSIGRKGSNTFPFLEDQHLSNVHAKFFILDNRFYLEDLSSTNGTWRRLSKESEVSPPYLLSDQMNFKIGTTSTFIVNRNITGNAIKKPDNDVSKGDCVICCENERDALYLPCKHNTACVKCSKNLRDCPICKLKIEDIIKIYRS